MRMSAHGVQFALLSQLAACGGQVVGWQTGENAAPVIVATLPVDLATDVAINGSIGAVFSEGIDPASVTSDSFTVTMGTTEVLGVIEVRNTFVTFNPSADLEPSATYTARFTTDVTDLDGTELEQPYVWTFVTGGTIDNSAPRVVLTNPADNDTNVSVTTTIYAAFSEAMDPLSVDETSFHVTGPSDVEVAGTVTYDAINHVGSFTPTDAFDLDTQYLIDIDGGATDLAGNALSPVFSSTFRTASELDVTAPTVILTNPIANATDVPSTTRIEAAFSEPMNPGSINATTLLVETSEGVPVVGIVTYDSLSPLGVFTPTLPLALDTTYQATVTTGAADAAGNALATNYVWTFTTADTVDAVRPLVILTHPADEATNVPTVTDIDAAFSERMDPTSLTTATFTLTGPLNTPILGAVSYNTLTGLAVFNPTNDLLPSTSYLATIGVGAKDLAGNTLAVPYLWSFTTGLLPDLLPPNVVFTNPDDQELDVPVDSLIEAQFSEAMDDLSLLGTTFTVTGPLNTPVLGNLTYDGLDHVASFAPSIDLLPDTEYEVKITTNAEDLAGNAMTTDYTWTFTTEAPLSLWVPINLRSLETFVAVAGAGLTNSNSSGITTLNGDVGLSPTGTCVGDGAPCTLTNPVINGEFHALDGVAATAKVDLLAAYIDGMSRPPGTLVNDISGMTLAPGVYTSASTMSLAVGQTLVLDGQGDENAVWIFQVGSSLTVNNNAQVILVNGARAKNVFWTVFASSTMGSNVSFQGSILAGASNSLGTDSVVVGRLLCTTGAITLLSNNITLPPL